MYIVLVSKQIVSFHARKFKVKNSSDAADAKYTYLNSELMKGMTRAMMRPIHFHRRLNLMPNQHPLIFLCVFRRKFAARDFPRLFFLFNFLISIPISFRHVTYILSVECNGIFNYFANTINVFLIFRKDLKMVSFIFSVFHFSKLNATRHFLFIQLDATRIKTN